MMRQSGMALLALLLLLMFTAAVGVFALFADGSIGQARNDKTAVALAEAKAALIGYIARSPDITALSRLPNPDLRVNAVFAEGSQAGSAGARNTSLLGKLPWRSLGMASLKDGNGECLWYVVSGRLKSNPQSLDVYNWDTAGQLDVMQEDGTMLQTGLAAILISSGTPLDGQNRANNDAGLRECGGNYDARNYLDSFHAADAIAGQLNYFPGSTNHRQAGDAADKTFVLAANAHYNDRFLFITVDEIFKPIMRRADFIAQIDALTKDPGFLAHLAGVVISGSKGTDGIDCTQAPNPGFCRHWREMLLLIRLPAPAGITVDGRQTGTACERVLLFSGSRTLQQRRKTDTDKALPENYLEGQNLAAFSLPVARDAGFAGASGFSAETPDADIISCLTHDD